MKKQAAGDGLDRLLYEHMPRAEEKWIAALEKRAQEEEYTPSEQFREKAGYLTDKANRMEKRNRMVKLLKHAAAIFLIMVSVSFAACMSAEATREEFIEFIRKLHADWTEYKYDLKEETAAEFVLIEPGYLPEGYREYDREDMGDIVHIYYQNEKQGIDTEIIYEESTAEGLTVGLDTEGAIIKTKDIGGENVEYFENKDMSYVYWTDADTYYNIMGYTDVNELLKMADSIINSKKYKEK